MRVALFAPCFVDAFDPAAARATVEVLERLGIRVEYPPEQTCCGQPQFNAGRVDQARELATRFAGIFRDFETVVSPSGSCVAMVRKHYPKLIGENEVSQKTFELCEFLVHRLGVVDLGARLSGKYVLHVGCHERRELGATDAVEKLVGGIAGLERVRVESDDWCCGFGGTFAVKFPKLSVELGRRKLEPILRADPDWVISTDASCLLHLDGLLRRIGGRRPRTLHVARALAARGELR